MKLRPMFLEMGIISAMMDAEFGLGWKVVKRKSKSPSAASTWRYKFLITLMPHSVGYSSLEGRTLVIDLDNLPAKGESEPL